MSYQTWFNIVQENLISQYQYKIYPYNSLAQRLFQENFEPEEAVEMLHNNFILEANRYAKTTYHFSESS